jgi:hypothetical protein
VHIRDKTTVGERLAAAGIALLDGSQAYVQGPTVQGAVRKGQAGAVQISFANVGTEGARENPAATRQQPAVLCVLQPCGRPS